MPPLCWAICADFNIVGEELTMAEAHVNLYSWNRVDNQRLKRVRIEEDTRDALQSVRIVQPSTTQRKKLLELSAKVGIQMVFLGFPAASRQELEQCAALVDHIATRCITIEPVLMARALESDIRSLLDIQQRSSIPVSADIFISISALRLKVEGWTLDAMLAKIRNAAGFASANNLNFRIAFEDSTRTAPAELARSVNEAIDFGTKVIVLSDTVGDCLPSGASRTTAFVMELIDRAGVDVDVAWHGHNDKGLSLANALAAIEAGASIVSGTFMGIGERTGNIPLEQLILILSEAGNEMYDLRYLAQMCELFCVSARIEMAPNLPLFGRDAFSTATGTHGAAILKARQLGPDFEDLIYSAVSANKLGRRQTLLIGPNSGRSSIRAVLDDLSIPATDLMVSALLHHCKEHDRCLRSADEILALLDTSKGLCRPVDYA